MVRASGVLDELYPNSVDLAALIDRATSTVKQQCELLATLCSQFWTVLDYVCVRDSSEE
jgi:hypothetical protein